MTIKKMGAEARLDKIDFYGCTSQMQLPRLHGFEFNDDPRVPESLRDTVVETLGNTLDWGNIIQGLVPGFLEFWTNANQLEILDLCSGAGTPARILLEELKTGGHVPPRFHLTDLFPNTQQWAPLCNQYKQLNFVSEPVDATDIAADLSKDKARVIINAFHHFPPNLARGILNDAIRQRSPIFIAEGFERNPMQFLNFAPTGLIALYLNPFLTQSKKLEKALWTWPLPIAAMVSAWDGFASTMRVYSETELREMVAGSENEFEWTYGTYPYPPMGTGYYFYGTPIANADL